MDEKGLRQLLGKVKTGNATVDDALAQLKDLPYVELGYATVDTHRSVRFGYPEVLYGETKTVEQILGIVNVLHTRKQPVLITRLQPEKAEAILKSYPRGTYHPEARLFHLPQRKMKAGRVGVVTAGTSDIPVAEEAALTAEAMGATVVRVYDVGVAGLHRLLKRRAELDGCHAIVAVAGMEGALAPVLGGLVGVPVVAVPTSIGYGASFQGVAALLSMLNSCASNVATVNIDNGFGAGLYAALISRTRGRG